MRIVLNTVVATLSLLAVTLQQDADAAIDTHASTAVVAINPLGPAIFDPAPKGFPTLSHFSPYQDELAAIAPLGDIGLPPMVDLPALKPSEPAPAVPPQVAPKLSEKAPAKVEKQAALTPEASSPALPMRKPAPPEAYMLPQLPAATVEVPRLPPRRPRDADRGHVPSTTDRIVFEASTLAPMGHTLFCLKYPGDCQVQETMGAAGPVTLTDERRAELVRVNAEVNKAIHPMRMHESPAAEKWLISPKFGDCNDYAVTKRHDLLALGWPSRDLLLAEVVTTWGEHHLVLVVRTDKGDFVADSLHKRIRIWAETPYRWVRVEKPENPKFWATIEMPQPDLVAMAGHDSQL